MDLHLCSLNFCFTHNSNRLLKSEFLVYRIVEACVCLETQDSTVEGNRTNLRKQIPDSAQCRHYFHYDAIMMSSFESQDHFIP